MCVPKENRIWLTQNVPQRIDIVATRGSRAEGRRLSATPSVIKGLKRFDRLMQGKHRSARPTLMRRAVMGKNALRSGVAHAIHPTGIRQHSRMMIVVRRGLNHRLTLLADRHDRLPDGTPRPVGTLPALYDDWQEQQQYVHYQALHRVSQQATKLQQKGEPAKLLPPFITQPAPNDDKHHARTSLSIYKQTQTRQDNEDKLS